MSFRKKFKVEGGQGGKRGHSGMTHWMYTEEIKDIARKLRRHQAKIEVDEQLDDGELPER
jgi:hypothetical protein